MSEKSFNNLFKLIKEKQAVKDFMQCKKKCLHFSCGTEIRSSDDPRSCKCHSNPIISVDGAPRFSGVMMKITC